MEIDDLRTVDEAMMERYRTRLFLARLSDSTRLTRGQTAPRAFFRWAVRRGHVSVDPTKDLPSMRVRHFEPIAVLTRAEVGQLFRCSGERAPRRGKREPEKFFELRVERHGVAELRDRALMMLMYDVPLRASEPGLLERRDFDANRREITVRGGKWQREPFRTVLLESTCAAMVAYLGALELSRWNDSPALFPPLGVRRRDSKRPYSGVQHFQVYRIFKRRVRAAGIQAKGRRLSPHCFRYSRSDHWREEGVSLDDIAALLRHRDLGTVRRYVRDAPVKRLKRRADFKSVFRRVERN
jgi:site-specific recombinase XerD